jgi:hypothetical protein
MMECWNNEKMGSGIMKFGVNGKFCVENKIKNGSYPLKNNLPLFHYSIVEANV